ncbi:hypothetical protein BVER_01238c [Candidatus Burkholderia verschuerenii]|uniref:Uncharacterized protein n=1 Tax=Candidatus Burkholderia verschuerenii TaxID=242163 RepID=A0A0L0MBA2_9BURK|nr:hypothetical protein [Candidatus Burkholderia verschuerenii]KND59608.1 hypothetical protein BVER_01238c [Candidatus Burkholderia verschuerenii]
MRPTVSVSVNPKGQAIITQEATLVEYCTQRAQALRAMIQVLGNSVGQTERPHVAPATIVSLLMRLIREHVDELEPLMMALDQQAYEKGFEDGRNLSVSADQRAGP